MIIKIMEHFNQKFYVQLLLKGCLTAQTHVYMHILTQKQCRSHICTSRLQHTSHVFLCFHYTYIFLYFKLGSGLLEAQLISLMQVSSSPKYKWANQTSNLLLMIILMSVPMFVYFHCSTLFHCLTILQFLCSTNEHLCSSPFFYYRHCCNDHSNT